MIGLSVAPAGVGRPISAEDIFEDIVLDNLRYDPKFIVENYLNMFVRQRPNSMPVFKYTHSMGVEIGKDIAAYLPTLTSLDSFRNQTIRKSMARKRKKYEGSLSISGLIDACAPSKAFGLIPYLEEGEIDVDELESMLKQELIAVESQPTEKKALLKDSNYRKCIRIYDYLRYGNDGAPQPSPIVRTTGSKPSSS